jgi:hypothetical protein
MAGAQHGMRKLARHGRSMGTVWYVWVCLLSTVHNFATSFLTVHCNVMYGTKTASDDRIYDMIWYDPQYHTVLHGKNETMLKHDAYLVIDALNYLSLSKLHFKTLKISAEQSSERSNKHSTLHGPKGQTMAIIWVVELLFGHEPRQFNPWSVFERSSIPGKTWDFPPPSSGLVLESPCL